MSETEHLQNTEDNNPSIETSNNEKAIVTEIEANNAEDAEDNDNTVRHDVATKDYHAMDMDMLVEEFRNLVKNHPVQTISKQFNALKDEFNSQYSALVEDKKEAFIADGGNAIDFRFTASVKKHFSEVYNDYKTKRNAYYNTLEKNLKDNLSKRNALIEELKGLLSVEENINNTYNQFKTIQESWRNAGAIPRDKYNTVWNTYHHHVERFYDFLHLNRDLRDLDFKHNLEEKQKIIAHAKTLSEHNDILYAFRELQLLHKTWKEDIGPVGKAHRELIWQEFSAITKVIHTKKQAYYEQADKIQEANLLIKKELIAKIVALINDIPSNHNDWKHHIKQIEIIREAFFKVGKVPRKVNQKTWTAFKQAVSTFNKAKNDYYKTIKKEQLSNLVKKQELINIAEANCNSDDFEKATQLFKKIQADWKKIGHVPRKNSDAVWNKFKTTCNIYFDRINAKRNEENTQEIKALADKEAYLTTVKSVTLEGSNSEKLAAINTHITHWKSIGKVSRNKKNINSSFHAAIDGLFNQLDIDKKEADLIKYQHKLATIEGDEVALEKELLFVKRKLDEGRSEINQLENNLSFFANAKPDNPLVKEVHANIARQKENLSTWKEKMKRVKTLFV